MAATPEPESDEAPREKTAASSRSKDAHDTSLPHHPPSPPPPPPARGEAAAGGATGSAGRVRDGEREVGGTGLIGGSRPFASRGREEGGGDASRDAASKVAVGVGQAGGQGEDAAWPDDDMSDPWDALLQDGQDGMEDAASHGSPPEAMPATAQGASPGEDKASRCGGSGGMDGRAGGGQARDSGRSGSGREEAEEEGAGEDGMEARELRGQLYGNLVLSYLKTGDADQALEISSKVLFLHADRERQRGREGGGGSGGGGGRGAVNLTSSPHLSCWKNCCGGTRITACAARAALSLRPSTTNGREHALPSSLPTSLPSLSPFLPPLAYAGRGIISRPRQAASAAWTGPRRCRQVSSLENLL